MKQAAGTVLYRQTPQGIVVLLVHPSGNYNRHALWSIPKGEPEPGESLEQTARRETEEEAGMRPELLEPLGSITYRKSGKQVHAFVGAAPADEPQPASWEIDQARFVSLSEARQILHPDQVPFLDRLVEWLSIS